MTQRNKNNSIIFLTTLSVYLGLVLVGATPQILAQTSITREEYEARVEREDKEELDKPLNDENLFIPQIIHLVKELNALSQKQAFNWNANNNYQVDGLGFCESDNSPSFGGGGTFGNRRADEILDDFVVRLGREITKRRVADKLGDYYSQNVKYDFFTSNSTFSIKTTIENKNSQDTQTFFNEVKSYFENFVSYPDSYKEKIIYENTKITSENNQVIIVTRLPRGSLDELLKQDAKAESK